MVNSAASEFRIPNRAECSKVVSSYIGYGEESDTDTFHSARILDIHNGQAGGELRSVKVRIELPLNDQGDEARPIKKTFEDVVWLVERDGRWRLAKASALLYAAFAAYNVPEDILDAPDLASQDSAYRQKTAAEEKARRAEQATFREPEHRVFMCKGRTSSYDDPAYDLHVQGSRQLSHDKAERYGAADFGASRSTLRATISACASSSAVARSRICFRSASTSTHPRRIRPISALSWSSTWRYGPTAGLGWPMKMSAGRTNTADIHSSRSRVASVVMLRPSASV